MDNFTIPLHNSKIHIIFELCKTIYEKNRMSTPAMPSK